MKGTLAITGDPDADALLQTDPLALLLGMLLDQQIPMEWAFAGPAKLLERLGALDATAMAAMDPEQLSEVFRAKPALHRYPASMAKRAHALCEHLVEYYGGDAGRIWNEARSGHDLFDRLRALPGYGDEKARIFVALLAKRFDVRPAGWEGFAGSFADDEPRSVADVDGPDALAAVRAYKKRLKAQGKPKDG